MNEEEKYIQAYLAQVVRGRIPFVISAIILLLCGIECI